MAFDFDTIGAAEAWFPTVNVFNDTLKTGNQVRLSNDISNDINGIVYWGQATAPHQSQDDDMPALASGDYYLPCEFINATGDLGTYSTSSPDLANVKSDLDNAVADEGRPFYLHVSTTARSGATAMTHQRNRIRLEQIEQSPFWYDDGFDEWHRPTLRLAGYLYRNNASATESAQFFPYCPQDYVYTPLNSGGSAPLYTQSGFYRDPGVGFVWSGLRGDEIVIRGLPANVNYEVLGDVMTYNDDGADGNVLEFIGPGSTLASGTSAGTSAFSVSLTIPGGWSEGDLVGIWVSIDSWPDNDPGGDWGSDDLDGFNILFPFKPKAPPFHWLYEGDRLGRGYYS